MVLLLSLFTFPLIKEDSIKIKLLEELQPMGLDVNIASKECLFTIPKLLEKTYLIVKYVLRVCIGNTNNKPPLWLARICF